MPFLSVFLFYLFSSKLGLCAFYSFIHSCTCFSIEVDHFRCYFFVLFITKTIDASEILMGIDMDVNEMRMKVKTNGFSFFLPVDVTSTEKKG